MKQDKFEEYDNKRKLLNEWGVHQYRLQAELVMEILRDDNEICGLLGTVKGENGIYEVESIYLEETDGSSEREIVCHLNYPAFEIDVPFEDFSIWERQQMIELVFKLLRKRNNFNNTDKRSVTKTEEKSE